MKDGFKMLVRFKCKDGQAHIKCIPLIPVTEEAKKLTLTRTQVRLLPGTNEVTDDEWAVMQPHIKSEIAAGTIVAVEKTVPGKGKGKPIKAKNLAQLPPKTAIKYVADCLNPETLIKWLKTEARDEVRVAIIKKMEDLKIEIPKENLENDDDTDLDTDTDTDTGAGENGEGSGLDDEGGDK